MVNRKIPTCIWLICLVVLFLSVQIAAQDEDSGTAEITGEAVPDDGTVTEEPVDPVVEAEPAEPVQPEVEPETTAEEEEQATQQTPQPQRSSTPRRRLQLLDALGPDITDVRIPEYSVEKEKSQILAEIDDPELQKDTEEVQPDNSDSESTGDEEQSKGESSLAKAIQSMDYSVRNLIAWGSLGALLILMIVLYRLRTGRKRRRVFRKIPSKRR